MVEKSKTSDFMFCFASQMHKNSEMDSFLIYQVDSRRVLFIKFYIYTLC